MKKIKSLTAIFVLLLTISKGQSNQDKLFRAIEIDNSDSVSAAISAGASVNDPFPKEGYFKTDGYTELTPLMKAAGDNKLNALTALLAVKKIKVNATTDQEANHPFETSSIRKVQTKSLKNKTALMFAAYNGHFEAVKKLVEAKADPLLEMEVKFIAPIVRNGVSVKNATFTAKQLAGERGYPEIEEYLKKARNSALMGMWK